MKTDEHERPYIYWLHSLHTTHEWMPLLAMPHATHTKHRNNRAFPSFLQVFLPSSSIYMLVFSSFFSAFSELRTCLPTRFREPQKKKTHQESERKIVYNMPRMDIQVLLILLHATCCWILYYAPHTHYYCHTCHCFITQNLNCFHRKAHQRVHYRDMSLPYQPSKHEVLVFKNEHAEPNKETSYEHY